MASANIDTTTEILLIIKTTPANLRSFTSSRQILPLKFVYINEVKDLATSCFLFVKHATLYTVCTFRYVFLTSADVNTFKFTELDIINWLLEGDIHFIISHIHQGIIFLATLYHCRCRVSKIAREGDLRAGCSRSSSQAWQVHKVKVQHDVLCANAARWSEQAWMYAYAQAARCNLGECATPWDVMFSRALAGCAAGSCYKQCMLIDRDMNCVHVASSSFVNLTHDDAVKSEWSWLSVELCHHCWQR